LAAAWTCSTVRSSSSPTVSAELDFADQPPPQLGHHREADKINEGERSIERRRDDRGTTFAVRHRPSDNAVDVLREQVTYLLGVIDADIYE